MNEQPVSVNWNVPGIHCGQCVKTIERHLSQLDGVATVQADVATRTVNITYQADQLDEADLRQKLKAIGFPPGQKPERDTDTPATPQLAGVLLLTAGVVVLGLMGYLGYVFYPRFGLSGSDALSLGLLAVGAGVASFFSPCSFPLLVTLLARDEAATSARQGGPVVRFAGALALGAVAFFGLSGLVLALGGQTLAASVTFTSVAGRILRGVVGFLLIALGGMQLGVLPFDLSRVARAVRPLLKLQARQRRRAPLAGYAIFGFAYPVAGFG